MAEKYILQHSGEEIDGLLEKVQNIPEDVSTLKFEIVSKLPTENINTSTIYLIKTANNDYEEYIYIDSKWEMLGTTKVDLSGYATESYVNTEVAKKANVSDVLTKTNTTAFTPSANYHPATKTYVDTAVSKKANTSDVLTKTNTTAFTPSANYHPATKSYVDTAIAALGNTSVKGIGIEVGELQRNTSEKVTKTLEHPAIAVIAAPNRCIWYDEMSKIDELSYTVILLPGKTEQITTTASMDHEVTLSSDGKTLSMKAKTFGFTYISFYQL